MNYWRILKRWLSEKEYTDFVQAKTRHADVNSLVLYHSSRRWLECPINSKRSKYWERVYRNAQKKIERGAECMS